MDFDYSAREKAMAEEVAALLSVGELPDPEQVDHSSEKQIQKTLRAWLPPLGEAGLLDPKRSPVALLKAEQTLANKAPWLVVAASSNRMLADLIKIYGSEQAKEEVAPALISGERVGALAFSEPGMGALPNRIQTRASKTDDGFKLVGEKGPVTNAALADEIAVLAHTKPNPQLFLVPGKARGLKFSPRERSLGYQALAISSFFLEQVSLPDWRALDLKELDPAAAFRATEDERATSCSLGLAERCLQEARAHADRPRPDGHGKPPAGYQMVRFNLAEMLTLIQTGELLAQRAASARALSDNQADDLAMCAKVFCTEMAVQVADQAMQIMATAGYLGSNAVERALRDARLGPISGNNSEAARMAIADRALAGHTP